jgi:glycosyltransferase involved in cell wall biosynthesis
VKIWLIRDLEPIPTDPGDRRLMRAGMLAQTLARRGHDTVWFTSSFDHYQKRQRASADKSIQPEANLTIEVFRARGYSRNIGLARIAHNRAFAARWREHAALAAQRPDVLVTDVPTTEAAEAVTQFGQQNGIPVVLSIRDLWPDFFVDYLPPLLRPLARPFVTPLDLQVRNAARAATSLIGISDEYLNWGRRKGGRAPNALDRVFPLGYAPRPQPDETAIRALRSRLAVADRSIVTFVGSWGQTYDLDLVLDAARRLADRDDIVFVIAGDKDTQPRLRDALAAVSNVKLTGWLDADEIAALIGASAIGLLPYQPNAPQGLPNKIFEYMAYGAYQLASLEGEARRFYAETDAGRVVGRAFAEAIPAALPEALDPVKRAARIALFNERYSAGKIYYDMVDHIEHVAQLSRRRPGSALRS